MERRRFSLADGMFLIAATAVGLCLLRMFYQSTGTRSTGPIYPTYNPSLMIVSSALMLAPWSFAVLVLLLLPPRLRFRRIARTPAFAATLIPLVVIAYYVTIVVIEILFDPKQRQLGTPFCATFLPIPTFVGLALGATWISIAVSGQWKRHRSADWRSALGITLGWGWLASMISMEAVRYFV